MPIDTILEVSKRIDNARTANDVMNSIVEEVGELAREVRCAYGPSYKEAGYDGILGEGVDVIASVVDLMYIHDPDVDVGDIMCTLREKLEKWEEKEKTHAVELARQNREQCIHDWCESRDIGYVECTKCGEIESDYYPPCCAKEKRDFNGWCTECGQPGF
jgi:NTP pyrophosphatase (non-canonical NTP hydrolase)